MGVRLVSPQEIAMLLQRHRVAVALVLILAAGLGYHIDRTVPGYADTATVEFTAPKGTAYNRESLLVIDELTANSVMSARGQEEVRSAGGTANYNVALINFYNEDFPYYGVPYVTVTTMSHDAADTQRTFPAVMEVLRNDLAALQARQGAKPDSWVGLRTIAAPTGAVPETGSRKRTLGGLAILTIVAAFMVAAFFDRHPLRLRGPARRRYRMERAAQDRPTI